MWTVGCDEFMCLDVSTVGPLNVQIPYLSLCV
jgi:hypothetical protein